MLNLSNKGQPKSVSNVEDITQLSNRVGNLNNLKTENKSSIVNAVNEVADGAEDSVAMAKSWAVGGTGKRTGEDNDNAKYYAERAGDANDETQQAKDDIQQSINGVAQELTAQSELALLQTISAQLQTIIDQGGSAGDLNGFSFELGEDNEIIIKYTDPDDETITGSATFPTDNTATEILQSVTSIAQSLAIIAGKEEV